MINCNTSHGNIDNNDPPNDDNDNNNNDVVCFLWQDNQHVLPWDIIQSPHTYDDQNYDDDGSVYTYMPQKLINATKTKPLIFDYYYDR